MEYSKEQRLKIYKDAYEFLRKEDRNYGICNAMYDTNDVTYHDIENLEKYLPELFLITNTEISRLSLYWLIDNNIKPTKELRLTVLEFAIAMIETE